MSELHSPTAPRLPGCPTSRFLVSAARQFHRSRSTSDDPNEAERRTVTQNCQRLRIVTRHVALQALPFLHFSYFPTFLLFPLSPLFTPFPWSAVLSSPLQCFTDGCSIRRCTAIQSFIGQSAVRAAKT